MPWTETTPGKRFDRNDGAKVVELSLFNFVGHTPDGVHLKTKGGKKRSFTEASKAMTAVDKAWPREPEPEAPREQVEFNLSNDSFEAKLAAKEGTHTTSYNEQERFDARQKMYDASFAVFEHLKRGDIVSVGFSRAKGWSAYGEKPDDPPEKKIDYQLIGDIHVANGDYVVAVKKMGRERGSRTGKLVIRPTYNTLIFMRQDKNGADTTGSWITLHRSGSAPPAVGDVFDSRFLSIIVRRIDGDITVFRMPGGAEKKVPSAKLDSFLSDYERRPEVIE